MKMQRNNGFLVPKHNWLGFRAKRSFGIRLGDQLDVIPEGSNLEGLEPGEHGGVMVRWKKNIVVCVSPAVLQPLTSAAADFLAVCS